MWIVIAVVAEDEDEAALLELLVVPELLALLALPDDTLELLLALLELAELLAGLPASPPEPPPPPHALIPTASRSAAISVEILFILVSD